MRSCKAMASPVVSPRTARRREFERVSITTGTIAAVKALTAKPPPVVRSVLNAVGLALGATESGEWRDTCCFLMHTNNEKIVARLIAFKPSSLTPMATRKIRHHIGRLTMEKVMANSTATADLFVWLRSVYAQASYDETSLSNYALMSSKLVHKPYYALRHHQPRLVSVSAPWE